MSHASSDRRQRLESQLSERILVLDGAMGTMIQQRRLGEADFRGERFADHSRPLAGCNDVLCLTRPDIIAEIHRAYFEAGADIVETNTFNANAISLADYDLQQHAREINRAAAELARRVADEIESREPARPRLVAGSIGPTNRTASLSPDVERPGFRATSFEELRAAYREQALGLIEGGADLLLPETTFDTLNLKACLFAIAEIFDELGRDLPVIASVTITDRSGRTLSGQTVEAFYNSISHFPLLAVGMNCALGAEEMREHLEELAHVASMPVLAFPNAGLPNEMGEYDQSPEDMARVVGEFAQNGWLNLAGGCCGTTPAHISAIAGAVAGVAPREWEERPAYTRLSGMEPFTIAPSTNFVMIGERTNVTGSRMFRRLISSGDLDAAVEVARKQAVGGANVLDVNMDEGMLDSEKAMTEFLALIAAEPDIARLPIMVDSSKWSVIEAGLRSIQGKGVANSISLKEGEGEFLRQARLVRRYGAAVVVMCFDEEGQATSTERRVAIAERAFALLTEQVGFPAGDIIIDPNILAIATGIEEHSSYGRTFIEAVREIKRRCPGVRTSGGLSNLSFSFRGNERVRRAIHAVFLYHAIGTGLDMAIVNAGQLDLYTDIEPTLLELAEDVVLDRRPDATERLVAHAATLSGAEEETDPAVAAAWRALPLPERVAHALLHGIADHVEEDMQEALASYPRPLDVIEGPLMAGMGIVGDLFGEGKMFLPQVVKSARVMKKAVAVLEPHMDRGEGVKSAGKIVLATVKGDVHDIGKNIVGVVLGCNGYEVIDLGVMVPAERILETARRESADLIGLSGLITPSLDEMMHVSREMTREGMSTPLLIGGATTSALHTAVKIAPATEGFVVHVKDASRAAGVVSNLLSPDRSAAYRSEASKQQEELRARYSDRQNRRPLAPWAEIQGHSSLEHGDHLLPARPERLGAFLPEELPLEEVVPLIDWGPFFSVWELPVNYERALQDPQLGPEVEKLLADARALLDEIVRGNLLVVRTVRGIFPAARDGEDILVYEDEERGRERTRFCMLRQQAIHENQAGHRMHRSLADLVAPIGGAPDYLGAFVVSAGFGLDAILADAESDHDQYRAILAQALADRLAEAGTELAHARMRREWGIDAGDGALSPADLFKSRFRGIRPAPGYPACPDHTEKQKLFDLLDATRATGVDLTESYAMMPAASVCGLVFSHPEADYFGLGRIGRDQVEDYARRKGDSVAEIERWLASVLDYDPS